MVRPFTTMIVVTAFAFGLGLIASCSEDKGDSIGAAKGKKDEEDPEVDLDDSSGGGDDLGDLTAEGGGEEESLEEILKDCGVDEKDLDDPNKVLVEKTLKAWPKVFVGQKTVPIVGKVNYRVQVFTKLKLRATMAEMKQTTEFDIIAEPEQAKAEAEKATAPNRGTTTAKVLDREKRVELIGENADWGGVICTVQPVYELATIKGGKGKLIKFDPPLPMSVNPKAKAKRYQAEIGSGKTFNNIKAKIKSSADPAHPVGAEYTGSVSIAPADPNLTLQISQNGGTKQFSTDMAFTLRFDFGGIDKTLALGLNPMQTLYIDNKAGDVKIVVVDTGVQETGIVVLSDSQ